MVAYFRHHQSDNHVYLSDLYVKLSVIYVDLLEHYVDLSEKYHRNQQLNILSLYRVNATNFHLIVRFFYLTTPHFYLKSHHNLLTSRHNDITSQHNYQNVVFSDTLCLLVKCYINSSDNYVELSDFCVDLLFHYVDLSLIHFFTK